MLDATTSDAPVGHRGHDVARDPPFERLASNRRAARRSAARAACRRRVRHRASQSSSPITSTASAQRAEEELGVGEQAAAHRVLRDRATRRRDRRAPGRHVGIEPLQRAACWWAARRARNTRSGRCASAKPGVAQQRVVRGDGARDPQVRDRVGEHRPARRLGEREHGRGLDAGAPTRDARGPRGRSATRSRERIEHRRPTVRAPPAPARSTAGRRSDRARRPVGSPVGTSGSRNGRLRCTGPAGGPSASATARDASARHSAPTPGRSSGRSGLEEPPHRVAVELRLVDRSAPRRCRAARAAGRRCTRSSAPARGAPRAPRGGSSRPRCPRCTAAIAGVPVALARGRAAKNDADRSSRCTCTRMRSSPASASASGAERDPGATHASVTPWRTHSSTSVRAKAVVASRRHARMPP